MTKLEKLHKDIDYQMIEGARKAVELLADTSRRTSNKQIQGLLSWGIKGFERFNHTVARPWVDKRFGEDNK